MKRKRKKKKNKKKTGEAEESLQRPMMKRKRKRKADRTSKRKQSGNIIIRTDPRRNHGRSHLPVADRTNRKGRAADRIKRRSLICFKGRDHLSINDLHLRSSSAICKHTVFTTSLNLTYTTLDLSHPHKPSSPESHTSLDLSPTPTIIIHNSSSSRRHTTFTTSENLTLTPTTQDIAPTYRPQTTHTITHRPDLLLSNIHLSHPQLLNSLSTSRSFS